MKKLSVVFLFISFTTFAQTEAEDRKAITATLKMQQDAWNKGDLEGFMQGYIKSDSLKFYGSRVSHTVGKTLWITTKKAIQPRRKREIFRLQLMPLPKLRTIHII